MGTHGLELPPLDGGKPNLEKDGDSLIPDLIHP